MPKDADWQSADYKENVNPLAIGPGTDENLKYDRAHDVVRSTVQDVSGGFHYDQTLDVESPSDIERVLARSTPTRTASLADPGSPSLSAADGRVDEETESEASEENNETIVVKSTTKSKSPPKGGSKKRKADVSDGEVTTMGRGGLRTRTPAQQTPFKAEKLAYTMTRARGRNVSRDEVEKQLKQERKRPRTKAKAKAKAKATSNKSSRNQHLETEESSGEESVSTSNHILSEKVNDEYKLQHTTLRIIVAGSAEGGIEVSLARFATLTELIDFIDQRWGRVKQRKVDHIECQRPWKGKDSNLTMFEGWDEQFEAMLSSVHDAPVWRKKSSFQRTLEVKITATLVDGTP